MTVGELKEKLKDIVDDVDIAYQRINDVYFDDHHWKTHKLLFDCHGQYHDRVLVNDELSISPEHTKDCYSEYIDVDSAYLHPANIFVLNAHY